MKRIELRWAMAVKHYSAFLLVALVSLVGSASASAAVPPSIDAESVSNVASHDATLEAQINPQSEERGSYYQFQLATSPAEFNSEFTCPTEGFPAGTSLCLGIPSQQGALPIRSLQPATTDQFVSLDLESVGTSLEAGTTYYYRVIAARIVSAEDTIQWEEPIVYGATQTFTTASEPPSIEAESVSDVTANNVSLEAQIRPGNSESGARYQFQLVSDPNEFSPEIECPSPPTSGPYHPCNGPVTPGALPIGFVPGGSNAQIVRLDLASAGVALHPGTTYYYRVLAATSVQTIDTIAWEGPAIAGSDQTFTTPSELTSRNEPSGQAGINFLPPLTAPSPATASTHHRHRHRHRHHRRHRRGLPQRSLHQAAS